MRIDRTGLPFIAAAAVPALGLLGLRRTGWGLTFAGLAGFFAFFFRDPDRRVPDTPGLVVAPADGRVMVAGTSEADTAPPGEWQQITVFLSPFDVHINRAPIAGRITRVEYQPGRFLPAYRPESRWNERNELWLDHDGVPVVVRQVVGVLARRIVCRAGEGDELTTGERFGLMKFGSRMDVFLPLSASLRVQVGDRVRGGETVLAEMSSRGRVTDGPAGQA